MQSDLDAASHLFGFVSSGLNYFQTIGALLFLLTVYASVRRWRHG
jgi:hypothetical protein